MPQRLLRDLGRRRGSTGQDEDKARKKQHPKSSTQPAKEPGRPKKQIRSKDASSSVDKPQIDLNAVVGLTRSDVLSERFEGGMPSSPLTASPDYLEKHLDSIQPDPEYMRWLETRHLAMIKDEDWKGGVSPTRDDEAYERALDCWFPIPGEATDADSLQVNM